MRGLIVVDFFNKKKIIELEERLERMNRDTNYVVRELGILTRMVGKIQAPLEDARARALLEVHASFIQELYEDAELGTLESEKWEGDDGEGWAWSSNG
jgi:hypothetical protein